MYGRKQHSVGHHLCALERPVIVLIQCFIRLSCLPNRVLPYQKSLLDLPH